MRVQKKVIAYLLIAISYVLSGKAALMLALPPGYAAAIFPPAGIALAAIFISGRRTLPWILLGSFLLNVWAGYSASQQINAIGLAAASIIALASMLQAASGGWLLRSAIGYPATFDNVRDLSRFLLLTPVICLVSASLSVAGLWAIGVFDANSPSVNWLTWWIGDSLGVIVMFPITMILAGEPRALWRGRLYTVAIPLALIFALFVMVFLKTNYWEQDDSLKEFRQSSEQSVDMIRARLDEQTALLMQLHGLFMHDANGAVTRQEFQRFTRDMLTRFPMIQALEWAPRVDASQRANFEAMQRKHYPNFAIREHGAAGELRQAGKRGQFYPVAYVEPLDANKLALGFDLASDIQRRETIAKAAANTTAVASAPIRLVQSQDGQIGMLIVQSVKIGARDAGVVLIVLKVQDFINEMLPPASAGLHVRLIDEDGNSLMYSNMAASSLPVLFERTFDFGARHYRLQTMPTPAYFRQHRGWQSWGVLAMGSFVTGLLGALLLLGTGYTARVMAQVEERTRELKESELRFRLMADSAPVLVWVSGTDKLCNWFNQGWLDFTGRTMRQEMGNGWAEGVHPDDFRRCLEVYAKHFDRREPFKMEYRLLRRDGTYRWVVDNGVPRFDEQGNFSGYIGSCIDITESRELADSLRASELRFRNTMENAPIGMGVTTLDGRFMQVNHALCEILGYAKDELEQMTTRDITHPEDQAPSMSNIRRLLTEESSSFHLEKRYVRKDGRHVWVQLTASIERDATGAPLHLIGQVEDITERKQSEEALRQSAEEIKYLYNHAPCGYHSLDKDGVFVRINDTELEWLGYTRDEVIGKMKLSDLLTPESSQAFQKNFPLVKTRGFLKDFENELVRKDGAILYGLVNSTIVYDADGEYLTCRSTVFDITERKKTEETLHSLFTALEHGPIAVTITDHDANIQYVSPRFSEITGYAPADVLGRNLRVLQAEHISKYTYLEMWNALTDGQTWHGELPNRSQQGRAYWEDIHITPVKTPAGIVSNYVVVSADITERKTAEEKTRHLANYDSLTDLPNRSLVDDRLRQALAAAKREHVRMAFMFLDLDKFKPVNDTLGHDVGDLLLKEAAERMKGCVRESDTVGRIGGDEFVVLLPTIDSDQHALQVAEKIRHVLNQPFVLAGQDLHISSSIGIALYPDHGDNGKALIKNADIAMYYAKEGGRNNARLFYSEMLKAGK